MTQHVLFSTGEEEEKAVFAYRAKLFRFDSDANQWKEKGLGEMKILQHKETGKLYCNMSRVQTKLTFGVSLQVRHKPGSGSNTNQAVQRLKMSDLGSM